VGACKTRMVVTYGALKMTPAVGRDLLSGTRERERERETDDVYYVRVAIGMDE